MWNVDKVICLGLSLWDVDVRYLDRIQNEVHSETKWMVYDHSEDNLKRLKIVFEIIDISRKFEVFFLKGDNFGDR